MTAAKIIDQVMAEGITLSLSPDGTIKVRGDQATVHHWLPIIREHKPELLALLAANEDDTQEATREAADERAAILEYDGGQSRDKADAVSDLFKAFYGHLMGAGKATNCCYAPGGRYCTEGRRLRDIYYGACS